jgi:hypothetical protein
MSDVPFSRSTDPGAQTLVSPHAFDNIAPNMGFSGVYSPTVPSLQHLPPPPSNTPPSFITGPVSRASDTATGKVQGVIGLTQPIVDTTRKAGRSGANRIQGETMRLIGVARARLGR